MNSIWRSCSAKHASLIVRLEMAPDGSIALSAPRPARDSAATPAAPDPRSSLLTARQREVLDLVASGLRAKQIAHRLGLSVRTIESHKRTIMQKADVRSTPELLRWYWEWRQRELSLVRTLAS